MVRLFLPCLRLSLLFLFAAAIHASAQVVISTKSSLAQPNPDAVLLLEGNGKQGLVIPIVSDIASSTVPPAQGMVVFCTCSGQNNVQYFNGTAWTIVGGGGGSNLINILGNTITLGSGASTINLAKNFSPNPNSLFVYNNGNWEGMSMDALPTVAQGTRALVWNPTTSKWEFQTLASTGGFANPMTANGDLIVGGASGTPNRLQNNAAGFLKSSAAGSNLTWGQVNLATTDVTGTLPGSSVNPSFTSNVSTTGSLSAGSTSVNSLTVAGTTSFNTKTYTWPSAALVGGTFLQTDATGNLAWVPAAAAFTNANVIPKGSAGGLVASSITDTGTQVDIISASPALQLISTGNSSTLSFRNASGTIGTISDPGSSEHLQIATTALSQGILFNTNATQRMAIDNSGNVGIGTTTPTYILDVNKDLASASDAHIRAFNPNTTLSAKSGIRLENGSAWAVQLQTSNGDNWLELTNFLGTPYHRWTNDSYYPNTGGTAYVQGVAGNLALMGGNVGIGTISPTQALDVTGNINVSGSYINFSAIGNRFTALSQYFIVDNHFVPNLSSNYDLGTTSFRWRTIYTNNVVNVSDFRLKKDILPLTYGLTDILKLRPVSYVLKDDKENEVKLGLIAQEVRKIVPEVVSENPTGEKFLGMNYTELIPVLIKAIQEQQKTIDELKSKLTEVKKSSNDELEQLKAEVAQIKKVLSLEAKKSN
jgi:hypothetical protein